MRTASLSNGSRPTPPVSLVETVVGEVNLFPYWSSSRNQSSPINSVDLAPSPHSHLLQKDREDARKLSLVQSVAAVLHALSSQYPEHLYPIGKVDFIAEVSYPWIPQLSGERRILLSLSTAAVSTVRDLLPPIISRWLLRFFLF